MNSVPLREVLRQSAVPIRIERPEAEQFLTVRLRGGGVVRRRIGDGKVPKKFVGYRARAGQFIYSRIDARNGAFGIVPVELGGAVVSKDFPLFDIDTARVDPAYWRAFIRTPALADVIQRKLSFGATNRQRVGEEDFLGLTIPLPPLMEQRHIATILDKADAIRSLRRKSIDNLDSLRRSIFHAMVDETTAFSRGSFTLDQVLRGGLRNGLSPSTNGTIVREVLTLGAITGPELDLGQKKTSSFAVDFHSEQLVNRGQILICRGSGNKAMVGRAKVVPMVDGEVGYPDTIIAGDIETNLVEPVFLENAWMSHDVRRQIEQGARTTNGTFKVNQSLLGSIRFELPEFALQQEFARRVIAIDRLKSKHQKQLAELENLFLSLQDRAFKGEL